MNGNEIRELGVPGFGVEVVGTDAGVDRLLPAAAALADGHTRALVAGAGQAAARTA